MSKKQILISRQISKYRKSNGMKIRIRDNSIRIRLSQREVSKLGKGGMIANELEFPGESTLGFQLLVDEHFKASYEDDTIKISIPKTTLGDWVKSDDLTISHDLKTSENQSMWILVEKDLQCKTERPREDDSDAFPNPVTEIC